MPSASLTAPPTVEPWSNFRIDANIQSATCIVERSTDGGNTWSSAGPIETFIEQPTTGCATSAQYRLLCNSTCTPGGTFTSDAVTVAWPQYVPDISLDADPVGPHQTYTLRAILNNPKPLRPNLSIVVELSDNGTTWQGGGAGSVDGTQRVVSTLTSNGCAATRQHRIRYQDCTQLFYTSALVRSWPRYTPDIELTIGELGPHQNYAIRAALNNPRPNRQTVPVTIEYLDTGSSWIAAGTVGIGEVAANIATLSTTGCANTRQHRLSYQECNQTFTTPVLTRSWPVYTPNFTLEIDPLGPFQTYQIRGRLNNPAPNRATITVRIETSDNNQSAVQRRSVSVGANLSTLDTLITTGCLTNRVHRLIYTDCGSQRITGSISAAWPAYEPSVILDVIPSGLLPPGTPYNVAARLANPAPNRLTVTTTTQYSDDDGQTWLSGGTANIGQPANSIWSDVTPNCGGTRRFRSVYSTECNNPSTTIGATSLSWSTVPAVATITAPQNLSPSGTYTISADLSGVFADRGTVQFSDDYGQTWTTLGTVTPSGSFTANVANCSQLRINRVTFTDFCGAIRSALATSCCIQGPVDLAPMISPASHLLRCNRDYSFTVNPGSTIPSQALTYQWFRGQTPLTDGATSHGSTIAGANTRTLAGR
jgi:hypothetical protein